MTCNDPSDTYLTMRQQFHCAKYKRCAPSEFYVLFHLCQRVIGFKGRPTTRTARSGDGLYLSLRTSALVARLTNLCLAHGLNGVAVMRRPCRHPLRKRRWLVPRGSWVLLVTLNNSTWMIKFGFFRVIEQIAVDSACESFVSTSIERDEHRLRSRLPKLPKAFVAAREKYVAATLPNKSRIFSVEVIGSALSGMRTTCFAVQISTERNLNTLPPHVPYIWNRACLKLCSALMTNHSQNTPWFILLTHLGALFMITDRRAQFAVGSVDWVPATVAPRKTLLKGMRNGMEWTGGGWIRGPLVPPSPLISISSLFFFIPHASGFGRMTYILCSMW